MSIIKRISKLLFGKVKKLTHRKKKSFKVLPKIKRKNAVKRVSSIKSRLPSIKRAPTYIDEDRMLNMLM